MEKSLVILGKGGVGKTSITSRVLGIGYREAYSPTIDDRHRIQVEASGKGFALEIIDTAGQEGYEALRDTFVAGADAALCVYAVNSLNSLEDLRGELRRLAHAWENSGRKKDFHKRIIFVGNKSDLEEASGLGISFVAAASLWRTLFELEDDAKLAHFRVSAKLNEGIQELLKYTCEQLQEEQGEKKKKDCILL